MVAPVKIQPSEDSADLCPSLVVEVEREIFLGLLTQPEKPLVLVHHAGFPKTFRYYIRHGGYFFLYRNREPEDLSALATELSVKALHASPAMVG
jgi:hypothetical protein